MHAPRPSADTILRNIEHVQEQTSRILQEQERDLLRAFRARLFDVQTELEKERARAEDGAAVWIEKNRQLEKELEWAKDMADRLDRHNQALAGENSRIKTQFKTQQDDREYLIRQLVAAKKDNVRLRQDNDRLQDDNERLVTEVEQRKVDMVGMMSSGGLGATGATGLSETTPASGGGEAEARYRDVIKRLKRLLDTERRSLRQVRAAYTADLQSRSELESLLRTAVDDVRHELTRRRGAAEGSMTAAPRAAGGTTLSASGSAVLRGGVGGFGIQDSKGGPSTSSSAQAGAVLDILDEATREAMGPEERKNILLRLLKQEQVITRLMELVFPAHAMPVQG